MYLGIVRSFSVLIKCVLDFNKSLQRYKGENVILIYKECVSLQNFNYVLQKSDGTGDYGRVPAAYDDL